MSLLLALALLLIPAPAAALPQIERTTTYLLCGDPRDGKRGTGIQLTEKYILTAWHVADVGSCLSNGVPTTLVYAEPSKDIAILERAWPTDDYWHLGVTCHIQWGARYRAVGYRKGRLLQLNQRSSFPKAPNGSAFDGMGTFWGERQVMGGMSGGPMVERLTGKVAAMIAAYDDTKGSHYSYARWLADTPFCDPSSKWYIA